MNPTLSPAGQTVERVDPAAFVAWFDGRVAEHQGRIEREAKLAGLSVNGSALKLALAEIGWLDDVGTGERRMHRWHNETAQVSVADVIDALDCAGVDPADVYSELAIADPVERWCGRCRELVLTDETLVCPWCEHSTGEQQEAPRHSYCKGCDKMVYPNNDGTCWRCGQDTKPGVPGAECECGCEATIHRFDRYGRRTRWVLGHAPRGREGLGKPVPLEPFACYLEEQLHEIDPVEALALLHGVKREDLMAVLNRRGEEVPRKLVQRALWTRGVGSTGAQRGRRPGIPTFYELYPGDARSKICPGCGGGKAPHAQMCKLCRRSADPSYMKPPTHRRRVSDELLAEAREIHERTNNYHAAARAIFSRTAYKSIASCAQALRGYLHPRVL